MHALSTAEREFFSSGAPQCADAASLNTALPSLNIADTQEKTPCFRTGHLRVSG